MSMPGACSHYFDFETLHSVCVSVTVSVIVSIGAEYFIQQCINIMSIAIGIDLGTIYTAVGIYLNGEIQIIPRENDKRFMPSCVAFTETQRLVGFPAEAQFISNMKNTIYGVKRIIGRKYDDPYVQADMKRLPYDIEVRNGNPVISVTINGEKVLFTPEEISAMIVAKVKQTSEVILGHQLTSAVITVPSFFNDSQRQATKDAGTIAGLDVLRILNEPAAAAIAYGLDKMSKTERNVLVYDLGGGTFDASILKIKSNVFEVQSSVGDTHLGGVDFDEKMVNYVADVIHKEHGKDVRENMEVKRRLKLACERAKKELSLAEEANINLSDIMDDINTNIDITRSKFEELCEPLMNRTLVLMNQALQESGIDKKDIEDVILVGGSSRIPKVRSLLSDYFDGKFICKCVNPDEAVAYGAAIQAAFLSGCRDKRIQDLQFVDVTPLSIGLETAGGLMTTVIERNTCIPCKATYLVSTHSDNQRAVTIRIFEGERAFVADNHLLGKVELSGLSPQPRGVPQIEVTFEINSDSILKVSAMEKVHRRSESMSIKLDKGRLSLDAIYRMVEEAQEHQRQDKEEREKVRHRNALESFTYSIKKALQKSLNKISDHDRYKIQTICTDIQSWLHSNPTVDTHSLIEKRKSTIKLLQQYVTVLDLSLLTDDEKGIISTPSTSKEF